MTHRHWAAKRPPNFVHAGREFWQAPHASQPRVLESYWYSEGDPTGRKGQFDVRRLPGYSIFPLPGVLNWPTYASWAAAEQRHHASVIIAAIDAGFDLTSVTHYEEFI